MASGPWGTCGIDVTADPSPSSDCRMPLCSGAALFGAWCTLNRTRDPAMPFLGLPLLDVDALPQMRVKYKGTPATVQRVAGLLLEGRIVAVVRGRSEVGLHGLGMGRTGSVVTLFSPLQHCLKA